MNTNKEIELIDRFLDKLFEKDVHIYHVDTIHSLVLVKDNEILVKFQYDKFRSLLNVYYNTNLISNVICDGFGITNYNNIDTSVSKWFKTNQNIKRYFGCCNAAFIKDYLIQIHHYEVETKYLGELKKIDLSKEVLDMIDLYTSN